MAFQKRKCPACGKTKEFRTDVKTCGCAGTNPFAGPGSASPVHPLTAAQKVNLEIERMRLKKEGKDAQIAELTARVLQLETENNLLTELRDFAPQIVNIPPKATTGISESAAVAVWSDWHNEEIVLPDQVSGMNEYNGEKFLSRFHNLCNGTLAWYNIENQKTNIKTIVLALLGDFWSGSIHADLAEANELSPVDAAYRAYNALINGIRFMLKNTPKDVQIVAVCHSGNHGRMTKEQRISTEAGNSLEQYMYYMLRDFFQDEPRVQFNIGTGYHSFVEFFEGAYKVRFHHGHQINYQGGVGGITIPANKAIAQWNRAHSVNLDVFGHFHTRFDGGSFISNGSMIGYNAYAVSIKASYEKPSQTLFLINREYAEKTVVAPVFLD